MMRRSPRRRSNVRTSRFESIEPRLLMSSQPAGQIIPEYLAQGSAGAMVALAASDDYTGLASARQDYGLTGKGQTVVVIDSGIAYDHSALGGGFGPGHRVVGGFDFTEERDGNPYDDGPSGSHGTHLAGIIGSSDPDHLGVAPGVDLVALRVFNDAGQGQFEWVEEALRWVHDHRSSFRNPITTVNLSLGQEMNVQQTPAGSILEDELAQLKADGLFIAVAAGNSFATYNQSGLSYPASSSYVVPVESTDPDGSLSYYSQRSERAIAAPGRGVLSTVPDYAGNRNGLADDYARYSGTSMAAPYVAAASVLLREAYQFVGVQYVNQDALYQVMRNTADVVRDAATGQNVYRLNLDRALDSIMPADDYGSTSAAAYDLGSVVDASSIQGTVSRLGDRDYFTFTAGRTGRVSLSADLSGEMQAAWELAGQGTLAPAADGQVTFDVVAGQRYTVDLGTRAGLGRYTLHLRLDAASQPADVPSSPTMGQQVFRGQRITSQGKSFVVTAGQTGFLTVEALFSNAQGDVDFQVYDANHNLLAGSYGVGDSERVDLLAGAGQTFQVEAWLNGAGANENVDFRITNLVTVAGQTALIRGTEGDDSFAFSPGPMHSVMVNGVFYAFDASQIGTVVFDGLGGHDAAMLTGSASNDIAEVAVGSARLAGPGYQVRVRNAEEVTLAGGGGHDTASLYDSPGDDAFAATPQDATFVGPGFSHRAQGFEVVHAYATSGGTDVAYLYDSTGNDQFIATPSYARLFGAGFLRQARFFDAVHAYASDGYDVARLTGSSGDDTFVGMPTYGEMSGSQYFDRANGFDAVVAWGTAGGSDRAYLYPSQSGSLGGNSTAARLQGPGFAVDARRFSAIYTEHEGGQMKPLSAVDYVWAFFGSAAAKSRRNI